jgi:hypothetical protein
MALAAGAVAGLVAVLSWPEPARPPAPAPDDPRLVFPTPYRNVVPDVGYVGDDACAGCHPAHAAGYRDHPMGRSLAPAAAARPVEGGAAGNPFEAEGFRYAVERAGDRLVHRQTCPGPDGRPLTDVTADIAYVVGSGERARSYLIDRDGYLYQSPISWFAAGSRFDLSPGYRGRSVGFSRVIGPECLFCHVNQASQVPDTVNRYSPPVFRGHAIGCERCHGPGELHAARADRPDAGTADDTIVNPARLDRPLREAVCEQCHLQGAVRVLRRGRQFFDFRPGLPLELFVAVYVRPPELDDRRFVGHVEEMHRSRCYQGSAGGRPMGCTSCHDPHRVPAAGEKVAYFRARCLECHPGPGCAEPPARRLQASPDDNCVACHMPRRPTTDIDHVATTDHRVVRHARGPDRPEAGPRRLQAGEVPVRSFHPGGPWLEEPDRDLGMALAELARPAGPSQRPLAEAALPRLDEAVRRRPDDVWAWEARSRVLRGLGRPAEALASAEEALARAPRREQASAEAAEAADALGRRDRALELWGAAAALNPGSASYRFRHAQLLSEAGDWDRALAECDAVQRADPNFIEVRLLRVAYLIRLGDLPKARAEFEAVLALHPRDPAAVRTWFERESRGRR